MTALPVTRAYRLAVAGRMIAAVAGGYGVAVMASIACAFALPVTAGMSKADAVVTGMLVGIVALPVAAMACVWARSGAVAWAGVGVACAALGGVAALAGWRP